MKPKALDVSAAVLVLMLALFSALPFLLSNGGSLIEIAAEDEVYTLPLNVNATHTFSSNNHELTLVIENSSVRVASHSCPDGLCAAMGDIEKPGETIVCLPAKAVIRILGESEEVLDGIAG